MKRWTALLIFFLCSCTTSYYEGYEQSYSTSTYTGYSYYNSPLQIRGLSVNDFYMLDNHPGDYLNTQLWGTVSNLSQFAIHNFFQVMAH